MSYLYYLSGSLVNPDENSVRFMTENNEEDDAEDESSESDSNDKSEDSD